MSKIKDSLIGSDVFSEPYDGTSDLPWSPPDLPEPFIEYVYLDTDELKIDEILSDFNQIKRGKTAKNEN